MLINRGRYNNSTTKKSVISELVLNRVKCSKLKFAPQDRVNCQSVTLEKRFEDIKCNNTYGSSN